VFDKSLYEMTFNGRISQSYISVELEGKNTVIKLYYIVPRTP